MVLFKLLQLNISLPAVAPDSKPGDVSAEQSSHPSLGQRAFSMRSSWLVAAGFKAFPVLTYWPCFHEESGCLRGP